MKTAQKITKQDFYRLGGFENPFLYRKMRSNGKWSYFAIL
jgi:hypothetical protein